jgi:hypothetical protein
VNNIFLWGKSTYVGLKKGEMKYEKKTK